MESALCTNHFALCAGGMLLVCTVWMFGDHRTGSRLQDDGCGRHVNFVWSCVQTSEGLPCSPLGNVGFVP